MSKRIERYISNEDIWEELLKIIIKFLECVFPNDQIMDRKLFERKESTNLLIDNIKLLKKKDMKFSDIWDNCSDRMKRIIEEDTKNN